MPSKLFEYENDDGDEVCVEIPMEWQICYVCNGEGKESAYLGAITQEDRDRDWDHDDFAHYMSGGYDRPCAACRSTGKVLEVDWETFEEQNPEACKAYQQYLEYEACYEQECRMERMMGC